MRDLDIQHDEQEVLAANEAFYRAVETLDLKQMGAAWWHDDWVQCLHPGWPLVRGWERPRGFPASSKLQRLLRETLWVPELKPPIFLSAVTNGGRWCIITQRRCREAGWWKPAKAFSEPALSWGDLRGTAEESVEKHGPVRMAAHPRFGGRTTL